MKIKRPDELNITQRGDSSSSRILQRCNEVVKYNNIYTPRW